MSGAAPKKQNSACHFCDHAARRSGRHKVAEQVACSLENCRKVFCSRRACMAKLRGPGAPQTIEEFRLWKSVIESGQVFFVCPHCIDQGECQGPQCKKRIKSKTGDAHSVDSFDRKRSYLSVAPFAGAHDLSEMPLQALAVVPAHVDVRVNDRCEPTIVNVMGLAPYDHHSKRRKSGDFEVIAPIPIRPTPLHGQFGNLKIA
ncbi:Uncharacterized protein PBTT_03705 [Plasmodiophora brassicae]|uniref:Uncharacterized protein n=1 Tax=Plasmodiophora brassicae TaxID=37360 RepID=A0A0G4ISC4_PLABS|nr:hypothetical protein PBRA_006188 [Plasmodiophora brassicae]SPQ96106.1 unnamed protein product [Plasmodiophora brassicae]